MSFKITNVIYKYNNWNVEGNINSDLEKALRQIAAAVSQIDASVLNYNPVLDGTTVRFIKTDFPELEQLSFEKSKTAFEKNLENLWESEELKR